MIKSLICSVGGGGIFSKLMIVLQNIGYNYDNDQINDLNKISIIIDDRYGTSRESFNNIFDQDTVNYDYLLTCSVMPAYTKQIPYIDLVKYKQIKEKLKINDIVSNRFNLIKESIPIQKNSLGVHLRLTDMNYYHPEHGVFSLNQYIDLIKMELSNDNYENIFIASDNHESITKLKNIFGDSIIYCDSLIRFDYEEEIKMPNFSNKKYWEDTFIDMLLLAECRTMIHRVSNFSNAVKIYSNNLNKTIML